MSMTRLESKAAPFSVVKPRRLRAKLPSTRICSRRRAVSEGVSRGLKSSAAPRIGGGMRMSRMCEMASPPPEQPIESDRQPAVEADRLGDPAPAEVGFGGLDDHPADARADGAGGEEDAVRPLVGAEA